MEGLKKLFKYLKTNFLWTKIVNPKDISEPIVKAIQGKENPSEFKVNNPNDIYNPIVSAIENKQYPSFPEIPSFPDLKPEFSKLGETFKEEIKKLDKEIVVKNDLSQLLSLFRTNKDKGDLIKVLKEIRDKRTPEQIDYTPIINSLISVVENKNIDLSKIESLLETISKLKTFEIPQNLINKDRIKVEVDRTGGGGWNPGETTLINKAGIPQNPPTYEKQNEIIEKLTDLIEAQGDISIDAEQINLNTDGIETLLTSIRDYLDTVETKLQSLIDKDFATQTTLALIKAKTDNLDTALSGIKTGTDKIPSSPAQESGNLASIKSKTDNIPTNPTSEATTITEYNITMTNANTEYSQALPANTKQIQVQCRGSYDVRYAFTTNKVATPTAPYFTLKAGMSIHEDKLNLSSKTIYFACGTASQVVELLVLT